MICKWLLHGSRAQAYHSTEHQALQIPESATRTTSQHTESIRPGVVTPNLLTRRESQTQGRHAYTRQVCEETSFQTMKFERDGGGASFGNRCQLKQYADIILGVIHVGTGIDKVPMSSCNRDCPRHSPSQPQQPTGLSGSSMFKDTGCLSH